MAATTVSPPQHLDHPRILQVISFVGALGRGGFSGGVRILSGLEPKWFRGLGFRVQGFREDPLMI